MINSKFIKKVALLILFFSIVTFNFSCSKTDKRDVIPDVFNKRVILEEFSGEWCGSCVSGAIRFNAILEDNPDKVFGISIHAGDPFEIEYPKIFSFLNRQFGIPYFPYALVDRTVDESKDWDVRTDNRLIKNTDLGLKIGTTLQNNLLDIKIDIASNNDYSNTHLTLYLVEDNVPESSPGAQSAGGGNYIHRHLLREVISSKIGDPIDLIKGTVINKEYLGLKIGKYKKENLQVIAFVHYDSSKEYEVINANGVEVGKNVGW